MYMPPRYPWSYRPPDEPVPPAPEPKYRFRWSVFVGIPVVIGVVLFLLEGVEPSFQFRDLMYAIGIVNRNRYVRFTCLLVVCIAILLVVKLFRNKTE